MDVALEVGMLQASLGSEVEIGRADSEIFAGPLADMARAALGLLVVGMARAALGLLESAHNGAAVAEQIHMEKNLLQDVPFALIS